MHLIARSLQNPTECGTSLYILWECSQAPNVFGVRFPSSQTENIDILESEPQPDLSWILRRFGFPEGPLGSPAPEESRRKIEQRHPQSEQRASPRQEQQERGDAIESVGQTADRGISKFCSDRLGRRCAFFPHGEKDVCERDAAPGSITLRFHSLDFTAEQGNLAFARYRMVGFFGSILKQLQNAMLLVLRVHQTRL